MTTIFVTWYNFCRSHETIKKDASDGGRLGGQAVDNSGVAGAVGGRMTKHYRQHVLSFVTDETGLQVSIHADLRGVDILIDTLQGLKAQLELGDCPHAHLFATSDPSARELTKTKFENQDDEVRIVHHVKIYGWNEEWARKHGLKPRKD